MKRKHIFSAIPFVAVLLVLLASVLVSHFLRRRADSLLSVNLGADSLGEFRTVRVFDSISSVMAIDGKNHAHKKEIAPSAYAYDMATTRLTFSEALPFTDTVIHVEGVAASPEQFFLYDFSEDSGNLLVILGERIATEDFDYTFDPGTRLLTFRSDIHPETDGNFNISYEANDKSLRSFGNFRQKDMDILSELEWQHLHKTQGAPMFVMKMRSGTSDRKLSKEVGFAVSLPGTRSELDGTFIVETMEGNEKRTSVHRLFSEENLTLECRPFEFERSSRILSEEEVRVGPHSVTKLRIVGTQLDSPLRRGKGNRAHPVQLAEGRHVLSDCRHGGTGKERRGDYSRMTLRRGAGSKKARLSFLRHGLIACAAYAGRFRIVRCCMLPAACI